MIEMDSGGRFFAFMFVYELKAKIDFDYSATSETFNLITIVKTTTVMPGS